MARGSKTKRGREEKEERGELRCGNVGFALMKMMMKMLSV